jgi:hypothetical protein
MFLEILNSFAVSAAPTRMVVRVLPNMLSLLVAVGF